MYRYNYIILGSGWDLYRHAYSDIIGLSNVKYYKRPVENHVLNLIHRIHTNQLINTIVSIPGKNGGIICITILNLTSRGLYVLSYFMIGI